MEILAAHVVPACDAWLPLVPYKVKPEFGDFSTSMVEVLPICNAPGRLSQVDRVFFNRTKEFSTQNLPADLK